jgi:predicted ArsR family transcriptional regulator
MKGTHGDKRFWTSTRGRIVLLVRRGSRTVTELAGELGLTNNAVRTHLIALGRDGLVHASGMRPGPRKPNTIYDLTPEADHLFPKVYGPLLHHLLDVLKERMPPADLEEVLRTVGHRMAAEYRPAVPADGLREWAKLAISVLGSLGGLAELEGGNGRVIIRSFDCPLATAAAGHPEVCRLVETLLADVIGAAVHQGCRTEPTPQCYFEVGATILDP